MKSSKVAGLALALFLQFAPIAVRTVESLPALAASPIAIVCKWIVGALAIAGAYHTVSAATGLVSPSTVQGKVGTRMTYQIKLTGRDVGQPKSWGIEGQIFNSPGSTKQGLPPGLSLALNTGIISGTPTQAGTFEVPITAYEHSNARGGQVSFTLTFRIEGTALPPIISTQPASVSVHVREQLVLSVVASGDGLTYQWKHNGTDLPGASGTTLTLNSLSQGDAGDYSVTVSNAGGTVSSATANVTLTPLTLQLTTVNTAGAALKLSTIPGRHYMVEAAGGLETSAWRVVSEITASSAESTYLDLNTGQPQQFWRYRPMP